MKFAEILPNDQGRRRIGEQEGQTSAFRLCLCIEGSKPHRRLEDVARREPRRCRSAGTLSWSSPVKLLLADMRGLIQPISSFERLNPSLDGSFSWIPKRTSIAVRIKR